MKKKLLLLSGLLFLFVSQSIFAEKVEMKKAEKIAKNFYYQRINTFKDIVSYSDIKVNNVFSEKNNEDIVYYIFNIDKGYVIVYADDNLNPVIGYSLNNEYDPYNLSDNYKSWMKSYVDEYNWVKENNITGDKEIKEQWDYLLNIDINSNISGKDSKEIEPLLRTTWNQGKYYNQYCPENSAGDGGFTYTGCVATAMGQIMYHYGYPLQGTGSKSYYQPPYGTLSADFGNTNYRWNEMENNVTSENTAVAELLYHCGISVHMSYSPEGSGAYSVDVPAAVINYFNYSTDVSYVKKSSYPSSTWENKIVEQLDALYPVYYSGTSSEGGHAFVCDGYQETAGTKYFHFNFGWSGYGNGFFLLTNAGGYSANQAAVINFYPDNTQYPNYCTGADTIKSTKGVIFDGSGPIENYLDNTNCSWLIAPEDTVNFITITFDQFDTEADNDILTIYDGETTSAPVIGTFSGSSLPSSISSSGSKVLITFISNESITSKGFYLSFKSNLPSFCNGFLTYTNYTDTISDGSGDFNYHNNTNCGWILQPEYATQITLHFLSFNTYDEKDHVQVYDYSNNNLLADYSGSSIPNPVTSPSGAMYILFKTNYCYAGEGWKAYYTIDNVGVDENNSLININIYPNPAKDNFRLNFNSQKTDNLSVKLISIDGKIMYSENIKNFKGNYNKNIDVKNFSKGIYILNISDDNSNVNKKIIIQ